MAKSWKPEVMADSSGNWYDNALRFATEKEAFDNARNLMQRWLAVRDFRATECDDPVNYSYVNGKLEAIGGQAQ